MVVEITKPQIIQFIPAF